jgi:hypothetical protein
MDVELAGLMLKAGKDKKEVENFFAVALDRAGAEEIVREAAVKYSGEISDNVLRDFGHLVLRPWMQYPEWPKAALE